MVTLTIIIKGKEGSETYPTEQAAIKALDILARRYRSEGFEVYRPADNRFHTMKNNQLDTVAYITNGIHQ